MKCVSRNKFLLCFRPVVDMDTAMLQSKGSGKRSLTCVSITESENEDVKLLFTKQSKSENGSSLESVKCHANKCSKRTLSRVIRAAMFQTTLSRRVRDIQHISAQPKHRNRLSLSEDEPGSNIHAEDAGKSAIPSLTSTEEPKNCSRILKQRRVEVGHSSKPKNGILLLLVSLTMTVLWGRLCAILFNLFWLYFLARRY